MYLTSWEVNKGYKARKKKHAELWSAQPPELQAFQKCRTQLGIKKGDYYNIVFMAHISPVLSWAKIHVSSLMKAILTSYTLAVNHQTGPRSTA